MSMIRPHYYPGFISLAPHIVLEEIGVDYELSFVNLHKGPNLRSTYSAIHPDGLVPAMQLGDLTLYESVAIILRLCEMKNDLPLIPPLEDPHRAHFFKWMMWLATSLHANLSMYLHPDKYASSGEARAEIKTAAERRIDEQLDRVEAEFAEHRGAWLLGDAYSAVDPYLFTLCRWSRGMSRPASGRPGLGAYLHRMIDRPAVRRAHEQEHLPKPWI